VTSLCRSVADVVPSTSGCVDGGDEELDDECAADSVSVGTAEEKDGSAGLIEVVAAEMDASDPALRSGIDCASTESLGRKAEENTEASRTVEACSSVGGTCLSSRVGGGGW